MARAVGVVRYLVEHDGLDPTRVSPAGYGEFRPRKPNDTDENRQQNRRVDIVLLNATNVARGEIVSSLSQEEIDALINQLSGSEGKAPVKEAIDGRTRQVVRLPFQQAPR